MKIIAFYLPQFHAIPENDQWWGKGFTEWVNIKASKPQFKGHDQPEIPLNSNYYNLLDKNVQIQQAELAKRYGVFGFCYYHYWFEGKLLLEKPMENMLSDPEVDIPFCICWANETWARTWDGQEKSILIKQNYNEDKKSWKSHFEYFLPYFRDQRYIRHDDKPVLVIYKPQLITNCREMLDYWNELAIENGLNGLFLGYQHPSAFDGDCEKLGFDFGIEFEPFYTVREMKKELCGKGKKIKYALSNPVWLKQKLWKKIFRKPNIYSYDEVWRRILQRSPEKINLAPGAFPSWDNTPRKKNKADIFWGATPEKFYYYFSKQIEHARSVYRSEFIFLNAWNEWAEGAHLEPDERFGYGYLEAIRDSQKLNL